LVNQWLGGGVAQGILNLSMAGMVTKIFLFPILLLPHCKPHMCSLAGFLSKVGVFKSLIPTQLWFKHDI
jgi:hypothetical protein